MNWCYGLLDPKGNLIPSAHSVILTRRLRYAFRTVARSSGTCVDLVTSFVDSIHLFTQKDMRKGQGCNQCTHPACKHSLNSLGVGECFECDSGVLVLDASSAPKWKLACNKCNLVVALFENAHKVFGPVREWFSSRYFSLPTSSMHIW